MSTDLLLIDFMNISFITIFWWSFFTSISPIFAIEFFFSSENSILDPLYWRLVAEKPKKSKRFTLQYIMAKAERSTVCKEHICSINSLAHEFTIRISIPNHNCIQNDWMFVTYFLTISQSPSKRSLGSVNWQILHIVMHISKCWLAIRFQFFELEKKCTSSVTWIHSGLIVFFKIQWTVNDERNLLITRVFKWRQQVHMLMNKMACKGTTYCNHPLSGNLSKLLWRTKKQWAYGREYGSGEIRVYDFNKNIR